MSDESPPDEQLGPDTEIEVGAAEPEQTDATVAAPVPDDIPDDMPEIVADDVPLPVATDVPVVAGRGIGPPRRRHRTWPQRLLLGLNCLVIVACFVGAGGLLLGRYYGNSLAKVELAAPPTTASGIVTPVTDESGATLVTVEATPNGSGPVETYPAADPAAKNFLITGADNNACIDASSPYAPAFGNRESMGERSDTVMIMRVDPATKRAAVLSFPRDLWVSLAGSNKKGRINEAYVRDNPQKLIDTLYANFGVGVDHFIQIDFCAFKTIVDGLGGVAVPFEFPARDKNTGLNVPTTGCFTFDGDHALAYVRSRKYQYQTPSGEWKTDGVSDLGRVSRQQDFLRRVLTAALDRGITDPGVARSLITAARENVVVDTGLTITRMLEFAGVLRDFEPGGIATYQIEAVGDKIGGASVLIPKIKGDNMQAILKIFRGEAPLAGAPEQVFDTTTTSSPGPSTTVPGATVTTVAPTATVPGPEENPKGVVPPKDVTC